MGSDLSKDVLIDEINRMSPSYYKEIYNFIQQLKTKIKTRKKNNAGEYLENIFSLEGILQKPVTSPNNEKVSSVELQKEVSKILCEKHEVVSKVNLF